MLCAKQSGLFLHFFRLLFTLRFGRRAEWDQKLTNFLFASSLQLLRGDCSLTLAWYGIFDNIHRLQTMTRTTPSIYSWGCLVEHMKHSSCAQLNVYIRFRYKDNFLMSLLQPTHMCDAMPFPHHDITAWKTLAISLCAAIFVPLLSASSFFLPASILDRTFLVYWMWLNAGSREFDRIILKTGYLMTNSRKNMVAKQSFLFRKIYVNGRAKLTYIEMFKISIMYQVHLCTYIWNFNKSALQLEYFFLTNLYILLSRR